MLRWISGQLLRSTLRQTLAHATNPAKIQEQVAPSQTVTHDNPPNCDVAVICSHEREITALVDRMSSVVQTEAAGFSVRSGTIVGKQLVVAIATPHSNNSKHGNARQIAEAVILAHQPTFVVAISFATALTGDLAILDLVVANRVVGESGAKILLDAPGPSNDFSVGTLLSLDTAPKTPGDRTPLGEKYSAIAADRIALPVALACQEHQVPLLAIHVVTVAVDEELPADIDHLFAQKSMAGRAGAILGGLVRRPSVANNLWKMQETIWEASDRLARCLTKFLNPH